MNVKFWHISTLRTGEVMSNVLVFIVRMSKDDGSFFYYHFSYQQQLCVCCCYSNQLIFQPSLTNSAAGVFMPMWAWSLSMLLKHNARQSKTSAAAATRVDVQQKSDQPSAVASKPKSHVDHLVDRVCARFISLSTVTFSEYSLVCNKHMKQH